MGRKNTWKNNGHKFLKFYENINISNQEQQTTRKLNFKKAHPTNNYVTRNVNSAKAEMSHSKKMNFKNLERVKKATKLDGILVIS